MKKLLEFTKEWYFEVIISYCEKRLGLIISGNRALLLGIAILIVKIVFWIRC